MRAILSIILILFSTGVMASAKSDADRLVRKASALLKETKGMAASLGRDTKLQEAARQYEEAVALYEKHIEEYPREAAALDNRLTQINSQIFWCNKLTTMAYYNAKEAEEARNRPPAARPAPKPTPRPAVEEPVSEDDAFFLMPPPARDEEDEEEPGPEAEPDLEPEPEAEPEAEPEPAAEIVPDADAQTEFLIQIAKLAGKRRFYKIREICTRMLKTPEPGIPPELPQAILDELKYVDAFLTSVFDKLMDPGDIPIIHYQQDGGRRTKMVFKSLEEGLVQMDIVEGSSRDSIQMSVPLLGMDHTFFVKNIARRTKDVMAGMASFYLLETQTGLARQYLDIASGMEGEPADLKPVWDHLKLLTSAARDKALAVAEAKRRKDMARWMASANKAYLKHDYDAAFKNVKRIMAKAKLNKEYLQPVSDQCKELTGKNLQGFTRTLMQECLKCKGKRNITCINCKGKGTVKTVLGKGGQVPCPLCKKSKRITCPYCKDRMSSEKAAKVIEEIKETLK
ncbi:hypothetical protein ACFL4W_02335 [Planctomycetota bacterium]